jgi:hypothetical protein
MTSENRQLKAQTEKMASQLVKKQEEIQYYIEGDAARSETLAKRRIAQLEHRLDVVKKHANEKYAHPIHPVLSVFVFIHANISSYSSFVVHRKELLRLKSTNLKSKTSQWNANHMKRPFESSKGSFGRRTEIEWILKINSEKRMGRS